MGGVQPVGGGEGYLLNRQALLQEPFQLCLCDSGITTKVEFIHNTSIMAELLESQVTPAKSKQVASCVGNIGEDVHLGEKKALQVFLNSPSLSKKENYQYFVRGAEEGRNRVSAYGLQGHLCKNGLLKITHWSLRPFLGHLCTSGILYISHSLGTLQVFFCWKAIWFLQTDDAEIWKL